MDALRVRALARSSSGWLCVRRISRLWAAGSRRFLPGCAAPRSLYVRIPASERRRSLRARPDSGRSGATALAPDPTAAPCFWVFAHGVGSPIARSRNFGNEPHVRHAPTTVVPRLMSEPLDPASWRMCQGLHAALPVCQGGYASWPNCLACGCPDGTGADAWRRRPTGTDDDLRKRCQGRRHRVRRHQRCPGHQNPRCQHRRCHGYCVRRGARRFTRSQPHRIHYRSGRRPWQLYPPRHELGRF